MLSNFPFSMENIPRQRGFACFSLKFASILSALLIIVYSNFAVYQCIAEISSGISSLDLKDQSAVTLYGSLVIITASHLVTLALSILLLVGALREKANLMKPWLVWSSLQVMMSVIAFVYFITVSLVSHSSQVSLVIFIVEFLWLMVRFYMLMLVASYYKELEERYLETEKLTKLVNEKWYTRV